MMMLAPCRSPLIALLCLTLASLGTAVAKDSVYSDSTVVIYNKNFPGSDVVASHYVTQRSINSNNRIALDCPPTEEISREQYRDTIEAPLREIFQKKGWWQVEELGNTKRVVKNAIHVVVLAHGIPLKIKDPIQENTSKQHTDAASVDSELTMLADYRERFVGWQPNPYFRKDVAFGDAALTGLMLVGRLDGPDVASCRRLIDDASKVERVGLWGRAYVDLAQKTDGGYKQGEDWLTSIIAQCDRDGIATVLNTQKAAFPTHYPMEDAALYFGWYTRNANGPFLNPEFQLKKGAVACHIHSYSAMTIRSDAKEWVGPLVSKGACGVLGNVYEPFLGATTHLDLFLRRLLDGYTLAEAAYMSTPYLSWMSVVVGDPLYRPFDGFRTYEPQFFRSDSDLHAKTYHVANKLWADEPHTLTEKLKNASTKHRTGFYLEAQAARLHAGHMYNRAATLYHQAKARYLQPIDQLRVGLQLVDLELSRNNKAQAVGLLRGMQSEFSELPEVKAVTAMINQLDPPGPSGS